MKDSRICVVTLAVEDLQRSVSFYEHLGWRRMMSRNEVITFLQGACMVLGLVPRKDLIAEVGVALDGNAQFPNVSLTIAMDNELEVDRLFDQAVEAGAQGIKMPQQAFWGGYSGFFADPDKHLWEVAYNPFFKLDDHGSIDCSAR